MSADEVRAFVHSPSHAAHNVKVMDAPTGSAHGLLVMLFGKTYSPCTVLSLTYPQAEVIARLLTEAVEAGAGGYDPKEAAL